MDKEGLEMGVIDKSVGPYTKHLLEFLLNRPADNAINTDLDIFNYTDYSKSWISERHYYGQPVFYILKSEKYLPSERDPTRKQTMIKVIAKSIAGGKEKHRNLKRNPNE